jgi:hypothetical protein
MMMAEWILIFVLGGVLVFGVLRKLNTIKVIHVEFGEEPNHASVHVKTSKRKQLKD